MRYSSILSTFALVPYLGGVGASVTISRREEEEAATARVAKSFIIEYASITAKTRRQDLSENDDITVVKTFDSEVFHGASIETETLSFDELVKLPDVLHVWPNENVQLLPTFNQKTAEVSEALEYTTHNVTGVNKLHAQGLYGKGVKIGVVDTGIWYNHKALGGGFGAGFKVGGGYDFVGNGAWPTEGQKEPDEDPLDQRGHGTHVAGIIAGQSEGWKGVAPEATLYAYKVFTTAGSTDTSTLIEAFLTAYDDGVDIITASIGGANGFSNNAWAEVASRLVTEGVVVTISGGNSGSNGPFYGSSGSSGKNVVAVASIATDIFPASAFEVTVGGKTVRAGYIPSTDYFPATVSDWPIVSLSLDAEATADGCETYPEGTRNLTGVVPIVRRGGCTFQVKQENLAALGAEYILIYNNDQPILSPSTENVDSLIGMISKETGANLVAALKAGDEVTVDFSVNPEIPVGVDYSIGNLPNTFTSWATLYNLELKPDIAAPGGSIFSTWIDGTYNIISGTSMACPYVAGVAALYIGKYGNRQTLGKGFAYELTRRIISSGTAVSWSDGTSANRAFSASTSQVGNGLIDAWKVLHYDTQLEFQKFALNDTRYFSRYHDVTVYNKGKAAVSYEFSQQPGAGVDTITWVESAKTKRIRTFAQLSPKEYVPGVSLPRGFTLQPGASKKVTVNFENPDTLGWNSTALPLYGGKVVVTGSNGEVLSVPYLGLGGDLKNELGSIIETGYPYSVSTTKNTNFQEKSTYSFDLSTGAQDFPKIFLKLIWGTTEVRWDIYKAGFSERSWKYPPVVGENDYVGSAASWVGAGQVDVFDPSLYDPNETWSYPDTNVYRSVATSEFEHWWFGKLANGTQIEPGKYTIRFAVLKPFGNPYNADNWDVYRPDSGLPQIEVTGKY
uniref:Peptidase S8/S53 domain-containing protein n=2 Tax=Bionectria ochroleuca TaxID=29856 RepID=A0A0B7KAZ1_BIOOC